MKGWWLIRSGTLSKTTVAWCAGVHSAKPLVVFHGFHGLKGSTGSVGSKGSTGSKGSKISTGSTRSNIPQVPPLSVPDFRGWEMWHQGQYWNPTVLLLGTVGNKNNNNNKKISSNNNNSSNSNKSKSNSNKNKMHKNTKKNNYIAQLCNPTAKNVKKLLTTLSTWSKSIGNDKMTGQDEGIMRDKMKR